MNLDRKFLEGFSEVSAANGLTPSQAHQLLMKAAKKKSTSYLSKINDYKNKKSKRKGNC